MGRCSACGGYVKPTSKHYGNPKTDEKYHMRCAVGNCAICKDVVMTKTENKVPIQYYRNRTTKSVYHKHCLESQPRLLQDLGREVHLNPKPKVGVAFKSPRAPEADVTVGNPSPELQFPDVKVPKEVQKMRQALTGKKEADIDFKRIALGGTRNLAESIIADLYNLIPWVGSIQALSNVVRVIKGKGQPLRAYVYAIDAYPILNFFVPANTIFFLVDKKDRGKHGFLKANPKKLPVGLSIKSPRAPEADVSVGNPRVTTTEDFLKWWTQGLSLGLISYDGKILKKPTLKRFTDWWLHAFTLGILKVDQPIGLEKGHSILDYIARRFTLGIVASSKDKTSVLKGYPSERPFQLPKAPKGLPKLPMRNPELAMLTPEEDDAWNHAWEYYVNEGYDDDTAGQHAWKDLQTQFPRLREYEGAKPDVPTRSNPRYGVFYKETPRSRDISVMEVEADSIDEAKSIVKRSTGGYIPSYIKQEEIQQIYGIEDDKKSNPQEVQYKVPLENYQTFYNLLEDQEFNVGSDAYYEDPQNYVTVIVRDVYGDRYGSLQHIAERYGATQTYIENPSPEFARQIKNTSLIDLDMAYVQGVLNGHELTEDEMRMIAREMELRKEVTPAARRLQIVRYQGKRYFVDERLNEMRNVEVPWDIVRPIPHNINPQGNPVSEDSYYCHICKRYHEPYSQIGSAHGEYCETCGTITSPQQFPTHECKTRNPENYEDNPATQYSKKRAKEIAKSERKKGKRARVVPVAGGQYGVFIDGKRELKIRIPKVPKKYKKKAKKKPAKRKPAKKKPAKKKKAPAPVPVAPVVREIQKEIKGSGDEISSSELGKLIAQELNKL